jgi:hypothetical protein
LGNTLERIESFAFYGCKDLKEPVFPDSLYYFGANAFNSREIKAIVPQDHWVMDTFAFGPDTAIVPVHEPMDFVLAAIISLFIVAAGTAIFIINLHKQRRADA